MLSMNGIIACELLLGVLVMGLIFTSVGDTDLIADRSSTSENETKTDGVRTATKQPDLSTPVQDDCSRRLLGEKHGCGSVVSGSKPNR